jgi:hypothetical protein
MNIYKTNVTELVQTEYMTLYNSVLFYLWKISAAYFMHWTSKQHKELIC